MSRWHDLNQRVTRCQRCPRLIDHCQSIARKKRQAYADDTYWGRPVPNFGDAPARILIVGLAPGAHGANRTGRMFTGDRSGQWLYRALYRSGLANQPQSMAIDDGLQLLDCVITAVCHCAPPGNRPARDEIEHCQPWLLQTVDLVRPQVFLALGSLAWKETAKILRQRELLNVTRLPPFAHGAHVTTCDDRHLLGSYHPSQQNTFTGRLTETMLDQVLAEAEKLAESG